MADGVSTGGRYEPWFTEWLCSAVTEETVFVDVGASSGHYVLVAACAKAIVAVEPNLDQLATLWENIHREGLANVTVIEAPLFSSVDVLGRGRQFHVFPDGPMETTTLDTLDLAPDIIKIDAEGAEYDILVGGMETLLQHAPTLLIEIHPKQLRRYGHEAEHVYHLLRAMGYEIIELKKYEERWWIRAREFTH